MSDRALGGSFTATLIFNALLATMLLLGLTILLLIFYYLGWLRWEPPFIRRWTVAFHGALVMRSLARTIDAERDLPHSLIDLASAYPSRYVRRRLVSVAQAAEQGQSWIDEMARGHLISSTTAAVLRSAERVGNLSWALRESSESTIRRLHVRVNSLIHVLAPVVILVTALPIAFVVIAMFLPLTRLIDALS